MLLKWQKLKRKAERIRFKIVIFRYYCLSTGYFDLNVSQFCCCCVKSVAECSVYLVRCVFFLQKRLYFVCICSLAFFSREKKTVLSSLSPKFKREREMKMEKEEGSFIRVGPLCMYPNTVKTSDTVASRRKKVVLSWAALGFLCWIDLVFRKRSSREDSSRSNQSMMVKLRH